MVYLTQNEEEEGRRRLLPFQEKSKRRYKSCGEEESIGHKNPPAHAVIHCQLEENIVASAHQLHCHHYDNWFRAINDAAELSSHRR